MAWKIADRTGKIFIDHNMNRSGANIAAAYSMRPEPRAPVSTPLTWDEVAAGGFEPQDFRIDNVWERFARVGDLFAGMLTEAADLTNAFEALGIDRADRRPPTARRRARPRRSSRRRRIPNLAEYIRKRDFEGTPEPAPGAAEGQGNSFVIHKHRATRLHYDVRLEQNGALPSWAVPKGLPTVKGDKRLAVRTEDHPLEYGKFSGTIPEGHYGAGEVRIFDDGWYEPIEWDDKKVSFKLHGRRYPGSGVPLREDPDGLARVPGQRARPAADRVAPPLPADAGGGRLEGVRRRRTGGSSPSSTASAASPR